VAALALPAPASASPVHFTTPSGNIDCRVGFNEAVADCLVQKASWPRRPPRPPGCDLDWAATQITLANGHVTLGSCRGDVGPLCVRGSGDACETLRYGTSVTVPSRIRCTSRRSGLTCRARNGAGAGFVVSRQGYRIFR
jgi:hypothetical protein